MCRHVFKEEKEIHVYVKGLLKEDLGNLVECL